MKLSYFLLSILSLITITEAQYLSDGWSPGQSASPPEASSTAPFAGGSGSPPVHSEADTQPTGHSFSSASNILRFLDLEKLLSTGPAVSLFSRLGVNITEKLDIAIQQSKIWDSRVPLITDENYDEVIVNEPLTEKEEQDRTWVIVITVSTAKEDSMSKVTDKVFDDAFNTSITTGDLPNVRWGRIDYFNVTAITTKWSVWNAPYLVILKDRGQTLRFYRPQRLRLNSDALRKFLEREEWLVTPPWVSSFAPGGKNEYFLHYLGLVLSKMYSIMTVFPRWMFYLFSGGCASLLISLMHRGPQPKPPTPAVQKKVHSPERTKTRSETTRSVTPSAPASPSPSQTSSPKSPTVTKRKRGKGKSVPR